MKVFCKQIGISAKSYLQPVRLRCVCILLLLPVIIAKGQQVNLYFENLGTENGLSHNKVNCITQDHRGFVWIGTDDGLNWFDGREFKVFRRKPGTTTNISGNIIADLLEDENGVLWIATADGGLNRYDYRKPPGEQFKRYQHVPGDETSIPTNSLNAIWQDKSGYLWIATNGHFTLRFDKKTEMFSQPVQVGTRTSLTIAEDKKGNLWVGRQGGSILKINPVSMEYEYDQRYDDLYADLPHSEVSSLYNDDHGDMWFGSWDKHLYRYNYRTDREETMPSVASIPAFKGDRFLQDQIRCFAKDKEGLLWMGGTQHGLQLYDRENNRFYLFRHDPFRGGTITNNTINCLFMDKDGSMWVGTNKGISVSNPQQQKFQQTFLLEKGNNLKIYAFFEDASKTLWIGTDEGVFYRKPGMQKFKHRPLYYKDEKLTVAGFFEDEGQFYLGTNFSLFRYNVSNNKLELLPNTEKDQVMNGLIESRVTSIVKDTIEGHPALIVSPYGHYLAYYDLIDQKWVSRLDTVKNIIPKFQVKDHLIRKFYKASNGTIWLANTNGGLGEWIKDIVPRIKYYTHNHRKESGIQSNFVYDVVEGENKRLWISTYGGGLHYLDPDTKEIRYVEGSPNLVEGLQAHTNGKVYFISNGNLHWYDTNNQLLGSAKLPDQEKTGGVNGGVFKDSSGKIYVFGNNYFIDFEPETLLQQKETYEVLLTDFRIYNTSHSHLLDSSRIRLPPNQNTVSFSFTVPDFSFSEPHNYAYRLEGVDEGWIQAGGVTTASYANLQGGDYTFRVKIAESPEYKDNPATELSFAVIPPFWKRWWFYPLGVLLIGLFIYGMYRYRINQLIRLQAIRNRIAQDLHDNIGSALSSISIYSEVAQVHSHRRERKSLKDILRKISTTSSNVVSEMSDTVWVINPRNDSMEHILQRMESFAKPLAAVKGVKLAFQYDKKVLGINVSMDKRKNCYFIFKEAFNNAIKYAEAKHINVQIQLINRQIIMEVQDNGKGFEVEKQLKENSHSLSGNGLENMLRRALEMEGECEIWALPGKGTTVVLKFLV